MARKKEAVPAGFQSANVPMNFWKPENDGESLRGFYQGSRILPGKENRKEQTVFDIADDNGELWSVSGASLIRQFQRIDEGQEVIIVYAGRKALSGGRQPMKDFTVYAKGLKPFLREE